MIDDPVRRLAESDPVHDHDPAPREDLLAQILELPRSSTREKRRATGAPRRLRPLAAALSMVVGVAGAVLLIDHGAPRSLDLAAQAYAKTSVAPGEILYTLVTTSRTTVTSGERQRETGRIEEWHRGDETHRLETYVSADGTRIALDHVIDAHEVMRQVTEDGSYRIVRRSDNEDAANVIAQEQAGFIEEFRDGYEQGRLDPAGDVQFAGRPARRYLASDTEDPVAFTDPEQAYYIDRETGAPLGYTSTLRMFTRNGKGAPESTTLRSVQTVRAIKRLEPTPANLEKLRTLSLPRRRDADGCIRGPIADARSADTASKRDCGGTPGAAVAVR